MAIDKWHELDIELSAWLQIGKRPTMWWRDDDAVKFTPALRKLVCLTQEMNIPLALAVIPSGVQESLAKFIDGISEIDVLQHGLSHMNHAPIGEKKAEFGPHRTKRASGVSLSTFKTLVWVSNLGGLFLFAIGMELMITGSFWFGISCIVIGVAIALFPSNYEIVGMEEMDEGWLAGEEE